jgi:hypothetical protein
VCQVARVHRRGAGLSVGTPPCLLSNLRRAGCRRGRGGGRYGDGSDGPGLAIHPALHAGCALRNPSGHAVRALPDPPIHALRAVRHPPIYAVCTLRDSSADALRALPDKSVDAMRTVRDTSPDAMRALCDPDRLSPANRCLRHLRQSLRDVWQSLRRRIILAHHPAAAPACPTPEA